MIYINKIRVFTAFMIILAFSLVACDTTEDEEESQDMHVCEHLADGPAVAIHASSNLQSAIDSLSSDAVYRIQAQLHTRYDVELILGQDGHYYGHVPYIPIADEGDYILYMDDAIDVSLYNTEDSSHVSAEETYDHSDDCADVAYKAVYHLHENDTYILSFRDSHESSVGMLFPMAEEADEDHDH